MAAPSPRTTGTNVLVTEFRNLGPQGWTENYIINVGDVENPLERALHLHLPLLLARQKVSSVHAKLLWIRASELGVGNDSILVNGTEVTTGSGARSGDAADPDIGWMTRMQDFSGQIRDMHMWRGWAALDVPYQMGVIDNAVPNPVKTFLQQAMNIMSKVLNPDGGAAGRYVIRSFHRPGTGGVTLEDAFTFDLTASGYIRFRVHKPVAPAHFIGDTMKLHVPRKRCHKGISGEGKIIAVDDTAPTTVQITLDRKVCCPPADLAGTVGKAIVKKIAYYDIVRGNINRMRKRKAGRPFGSIPGRRSGRCC